MFYHGHNNQQIVSKTLKYCSTHKQIKSLLGLLCLCARGHIVPTWLHCYHMITVITRLLCCMCSVGCREQVGCCVSFVTCVCLIHTITITNTPDTDLIVDKHKSDSSDCGTIVFCGWSEEINLASDEWTMRKKLCGTGVLVPSSDVFTVFTSSDHAKHVRHWPDSQQTQIRFIWLWHSSLP